MTQTTNNDRLLHQVDLKTVVKEFLRLVRHPLGRKRQQADLAWDFRARAALLRLNRQLFLHHRVVELHRETSASIISIPLVFEMPRKELTRFTNCNVVQRTI